MTTSNHHEHKDVLKTKRALGLAIAATAAILGVEFAGGLWTNSLALLSDAAHVLMDLLSFALSLAALALAERPVSDDRTFGWHRLEVFAALANALTVFAIAGSVLVHAVERLAAPEAILGPEMLAIATLGLGVNLFVIWRLHPHSGGDVNIRGALLHALGDALASVAVVGGGILVMITGKPVFDPAAAILVAAVIVFGAGRIFWDAFHILMEGMPRGLDRRRVAGSIEAIAGPGSIRDLHVWNICSHICALSVRLVLPDGKMSGQRRVLEDVSAALEKDFNIVHTTIQIESDLWQSRGHSEI